VYRLVYSRAAARDLIRLPVKTGRLIEGKLAQLARGPRETAHAKKLKGDPPRYRLRVGDWRAVYTIDQQTITIMRVQPRGGAYK
jgi:mRNA interferase RelE/StbE